MGKETEKILQLLNYWQNFIQNNPPQIEEFAHWLLKDKEKKARHEADVQTNASPSDHYILNEYALDKQISMLWGRLIRYTHIWSKKALQGLEIHSLEEYGLLKSVELLKKASKSELVGYSLLEKSTCFEMLKRLRGTGFLKETVDIKDKRSRIVELTKKGKDSIREADQEISQLAVLLVGNLDEKQKTELLSLLRQLNVFHENLYMSE